MTGGNRHSKRPSDTNAKRPKGADESRESKSPRVMDEWIDAYFDRALTEGSSELLMASIRQDPGRCETVARTQRMIAMLKQPLGQPLAESGLPAMRDQTGDILARLEKGRGFVNARGRRRVRQGRLAVAGGVLTACLALGLIWRAWPGLSLVPRSMPMSAVVNQSSQAATQTLTRINDAVRSMGPSTDGGIGLAQPRAGGVAYVLIPVAIVPLESIRPFDPMAEGNGDGSWGPLAGSGAIALVAPDGSGHWSDSAAARVTAPMSEFALRSGSGLGGLVDGPMPSGAGEGDSCLAWPGASPRRVLVNVQRDGVAREGAEGKATGLVRPDSSAIKR